MKRVTNSRQMGPMARKSRKTGSPPKSSF